MTSTYYFRPVHPGRCAECDQPYPALTVRMYLTAKGIVHPDCDGTAPVTYDVAPAAKHPPGLNVGCDTCGAPAGKQCGEDCPCRIVQQRLDGRIETPRLPRRRRRLKLVETPAPVKVTSPKPKVMVGAKKQQRRGTSVCRKCWTVHPTDEGCST